VVQEALTNIIKHAGASTIHVVLISRDGGYAVEVRDDGRGFRADATTSRPGHVGLVSMRQRVELTGGSWSLDSAPGQGTVVKAWVPAGHEEDADG
jgi:signal transduction histidine kinase